MAIAELLNSVNLSGLLVGLGTFLIIGIFHPLVIKGYYWFGLRCRWWFAIAGVLFCIASLFVWDIVGSTILGVTAFSCFWSIGEVTQQKRRVEKGWFPAGPGAVRDGMKIKAD